MSDAHIHPYYDRRKTMLLAEFEATLDAFEPELAEGLGKILQQETDLARLRSILTHEMQFVLANLPYVGGDAGRMTRFFEHYAGLIAVGRSLRSLGLPTADTHALMRRWFLSRMERIPVPAHLAEGEKWMSRGNHDYLRDEARKSALKENPEDFVYRFVESGPSAGNAGFDFGIDYTECGFCKLCERTGDRDLLPVLCDMDEEVYAMRGIELFRSTTLASGGSRCDFRFRAIRKPASER